MTLTNYTNLTLTATDGQATYYMSESEVERSISVEAYVATNHAATGQEYTLDGHGFVQGVTRTDGGYLVLCHNHELYRIELVKVTGYTCLKKAWAVQEYRFVTRYALCVAADFVSVRGTMVDTQTGKDVASFWVRVKGGIGDYQATTSRRLDDAGILAVRAALQKASGLAKMLPKAVRC